MDPAEYERRRTFMAAIPTMSKPELIEIVRILKVHGISIQENRNGMFFDLTKLPQPVCDELWKLHAYIEQNNRELEKRDAIVSQLKQELKVEGE